MSGSGHFRDELQELLDGRLDSRREAEARAHLDRCTLCQRELAALRWTRRMAAEAPVAGLPPGLERSVRGALEAEQRAPRPGRRGFLAAAASLIATGGAAWWLIGRSRGPLPAAVARDYQLFRSGQLPLEIETANPAEVEAFFRERGIPFRTRVFDLAMMKYKTRGGRVHRLEGTPSALFVYQGEGAKVLVCQMYPGRLEELPAADETRVHRVFTFKIYRRGSITTVFWQEGDVVCVLAGDFESEEIVALAFEKAML